MSGMETWLLLIFLGAQSLSVIEYDSEQACREAAEVIAREAPTGAVPICVRGGDPG